MIVNMNPKTAKKKIVEYIDSVAGEAVFGANIFRDCFASIRDVAGGRAGGYQMGFRDGRESALQDMMAQAEELGVNAVVSVDVDYEALSKTKSMLMVSCNGTPSR